MDDKRLVVFCSANDTIDPKYRQAAREFTRAACAKGYTIVSGGGARGLMGEVTSEAAGCGGRQVAVLPRFMAGLESSEVTDLVWTDTMSSRKEAMRAGTVVAVALPGGIGTLDELVETLVLVKLGKYSGRLYALNQDGFYEPLKALLDHFVAEGMYSVHDRGLIGFPDTVDELVGLL